MVAQTRREELDRTARFGFQRVLPYQFSARFNEAQPQLLVVSEPDHFARCGARIVGFDQQCCFANGTRDTADIRRYNWDPCCKRLYQDLRHSFGS